MSEKAPLLELKNVSVSYGTLNVINSLNLRVNRGEFVVIHGSTGCGKSTILHLIAGLVRPTAGEVIVAGDRVDLFSDAQSRWLRRAIGLMMQEGLLLEDRTIVENVMLPAIAANESMSEAHRRAMLALSKCGIAELADQLPGALSAGQCQLACLARAVVNKPVLILADEPVAHLDDSNTKTLIDLLATFSAAGVTVILATHHHLAPEGCRYREITLSTPHEGV